MNEIFGCAVLEDYNYLEWNFKTHWLHVDNLFFISIGCPLMFVVNDFSGTRRGNVVSSVSRVLTPINKPIIMKALFQPSNCFVVFGSAANSALVFKRLWRYYAFNYDHKLLFKLSDHFRFWTKLWQQVLGSFKKRKTMQLCWVMISRAFYYVTDLVVSWSLLIES